MTIVDLVKARAHANTLPHAMTATAVWIEELADEVESQQRALESSRRNEQRALAEGAELAAENAQLRAALTDICTRVALILGGVRT